MNYVCTIELEDVKPRIWRQFQFHPDVTFHQLHKIIQIVMGWDDAHLYEFELGGRRFEVPDPDFEDYRNDSLDARVERVGVQLKRLNTVFHYTYDFGDGWNHKIKLTSKLENSEDTIPLCLDGERCCPLEDVGGPWGHMDMVEAISDPDHPERESLLEWAGGAYDPERFSLEEVNDYLLQSKDELLPQPVDIGQKRNAKLNAVTSKPSTTKPEKLTKASLKKRLKQMERTQLEELILESFGASKDMEKFLGVKLGGAEAAQSLFLTYRQRVVNEFFPERGFGKLRLQEAKNAINEFWKLTGNVKYTFELKLVYVENGVAFSNRYGDIGMQFYDSMASVYGEVIDMMNRSQTDELYTEYAARVRAVLSHTRDAGWDFGEIMHGTYAQLNWDEESDDEADH